MNHQNFHCIKMDNRINKSRIGLAILSLLESFLNHIEMTFNPNAKRADPDQAALISAA